MDWLQSTVNTHIDRTVKPEAAAAAMRVAVEHYGLDGFDLIAVQHPTGRWVAHWSRTDDETTAAVNAAAGDGDQMAILRVTDVTRP